jgi:hypothetical protein
MILGKAMGEGKEEENEIYSFYVILLLNCAYSLVPPDIL